MVYVISYDIESDRIRNKLAKLLEGYGVRVQYSVFECRLTEKRFQSLYRKVFALTDGQEKSSVRFYSLCGNCERKTVTIGRPMNQLSVLEEDIFII